MKTQIKQYKVDLKALAKEIRRKKNTRKDVPNGYVSGLWRDQYDFRNKHIAYCLMRGRSYEQIEQPQYSLMKDKYRWREITKLMEVPNEDACASQEGSAVVA